MTPFTEITGTAAPLLEKGKPMSNVDTDMIIPKQFLKSIKRTGFGKNLFDELRYLDVGQPDQDCSGRPLNEDFPLNQARYQGAEILLTRKNFGCGSSREHAPWALLDHGIRVIISTEFGDIFYNNAFKNGMLPIKVSKEDLAKLMDDAERGANARMTIDLEKQEITGPDGGVVKFEVDAFKKHCLLNGLDEVGLTMEKNDHIANFEKRLAGERPWI